MEALYLEEFKEHLRHEEGMRNRERLLRDIERGTIRITEPPQFRLALSIISALQSVPLISDLDYHVLRNRTRYPFLFGDSPIILYNTYYQNVRHRGVLGIQTPGLQIFYPLDSHTLLMLIDNQLYGGRYRQPLAVDVSQPSDVSQLNALQLHHSLNAAYFADASAEPYVAELWQAQKPYVVQPNNRFITAKGWADGKPIDEILCHIFEPQLNVKLDLSFVECTPIDPSKYTFRHRSPELIKEHEKRLGETADA